MPPVSSDSNRAAAVVARAARALCIAQTPTNARAWLAAQYGANDSSIGLVERAAVLDTDSIEPPNEYARALADVVIARSALGKIEGVTAFSRVGFSDPVMRASDDAIGFWVSENMEIPPLVGIDPFTVMRIPVTKIGALAIFSKELIERGGPRIDAVISCSTQNALVRRLNASLFDGLPGDPSRPPSLIDAPIPGTGNPAEDVASALSTLPDAYGDTIVLVVSPWSVPALLASGAADPSTLNARVGGLLLGFPCVTSTAVPPGAVAWCVPPLIQLAEAGVILGASDAPVVRTVTTEPDSDSGAEVEVVQLHSCWQEGLSCIRGILYIGWRKTAPAAAGLITDAVPATITPVTTS